MQPEMAGPTLWSGSCLSPLSCCSLCLFRRMSTRIVSLWVSLRSSPATVYPRQRQVSRFAAAEIPSSHGFTMQSRQVTPMSDTSPESGADTSKSQKMWMEVDNPATPENGDTKICKKDEKNWTFAATINQSKNNNQLKERETKEEWKVRVKVYWSKL